MKNSRKNSTKNTVIAENNNVELVEVQNVITDNIAQNEIAQIVENVKEEQNEIEKSNIEQKEVKQLTMLEKIHLFTTNNNVFHNIRTVYDVKTKNIINNMNLLKMLNLNKNSILSHSVDVNYFVHFLYEATKLHNELIAETEVNSLREIMLRYNVKKIDEIEKTKQTLLKMYENFVNYDEEKKTFKISNIELFFKESKNLRALVKDRAKFLAKIETLSNTLFRYSKNDVSDYKTSNEESQNLYNVVELLSTYNIERNLQIMTIIREMCKEKITNNDERNFFSNETNLFFTKELFETAYNCNVASERRAFKKAYSFEFEKFKNSAEFKSETEKLNSMTYIEQIAYYVEKHLRISNFEEVMHYFNMNCEKFAE